MPCTSGKHPVYTHTSRTSSAGDVPEPLKLSQTRPRSGVRELNGKLWRWCVRPWRKIGARSERCDRSGDECTWREGARRRSTLGLRQTLKPISRPGPGRGSPPLRTRTRPAIPPDGPDDSWQVGPDPLTLGLARASYSSQLIMYFNSKPTPKL